MAASAGSPMATGSPTSTGATAASSRCGPSSGAGWCSSRSSRPTPEMVAEVEALPELIPDKFRFVKVTENDVPTNWKIAVEGFLEGYHIRSTHPDTFFPIQYDNVNVIEQFGRNNRVAFPYRNIEALRDVAPADRHADGYLTFAYQLFPNVIVATQPGRMSLIVLEPRGIDTTRNVAYALSDHHDGTTAAEAVLAKEESFRGQGRPAGPGRHDLHPTGPDREPPRALRVRPVRRGHRPLPPAALGPARRRRRRRAP